ncbi:MAG: hypothetical protein FWD34_02795 [Oscillospiraceae bacterium]|nr:hypothetical protein [Oscillospiraceae bacterium]
MRDELTKRKIIRLQGYDYSSEGMYFITICSIKRLPLFGEFVGADDPVRPKDEPYIKMTEIGKIIHDCWDTVNSVYANVKTDAFCVMPNHIHGIITIESIGLSGGQGLLSGGQGRPPLHKVVQGFKSVTTRMCFDMGFQKIWQRSYHDRIIRNEQEYIKIWNYINDNPKNWLQDCYY